MNKKLLIIFTTFILFSCKHELEKPSWDINMIIPLAYTELNIDDIIQEEISVNISSDSLVSLIYNEELLSSEYNDLFNLYIVTEQNISKVSDINFNNIRINNNANLGSIIADIPFGSILFPDGSNTSIPSFPNALENDTTLVDASEYFENMTLLNGYLKIKIVNNFPTDLSNIEIRLINGITFSTIADFTYPLIPSGTYLSDSVDISGMNLDKNIISILENIDIEASNGAVPINYTDQIITTISLTQLVINEATAIFPEQKISEELKEFSINIGDAELREFKVFEGTVDIQVLSTLPDTGRLIYNIPSLTKNQIPFSSENIIPPTINGEWTTITHNFDGYILDLSGKENRIGGDTINTIYTEMFAFIDSTGEIVTLSEQDSFCSYVELTCLPEYAKGYIGKDTFSLQSETTTFNTFNNINSGTFDLSEAKLSIKLENFIGADASFKFNNLEVNNTNNNTPPTTAGIDQNGNNIIGNEYYINRANINNNELPINPTNTYIYLDVSEMIETMPNEVSVGASIILNPNGQQITEDFIYPEFALNAFLDLEIPLSFIANNLNFTKTIEVDLNQDTELEIDKIYINIINGVPLFSEIDIILMDEYLNTLDTIVKNIEVLSANTDLNNNVTSSNQTSLIISNKNFNNVKNIKINASFTTSSLTEHVSIYSDQKIVINLSAKFKNKIGL